MANGVEIKLGIPVMASEDLEGKNKRQIAGMIGVGVEPVSRKHEELRAALQVRCVEDLEKAIEGLSKAQAEATKSAEKLSLRVFWLNVVLTIATVIGAFAALVQAAHLFCTP